MTSTHDDSKIGVTLGKRLIKNGYQITEIVIYQKNQLGKYEIQKLRDFEYPDACYQFQFNKKNSEELLFMSNTEIFKYDYLDESKDKGEFYQFQSRLEYTP